MNPISSAFSALSARFARPFQRSAARPRQSSGSLPIAAVVAFSMLMPGLLGFGFPLIEEDKGDKGKRGLFIYADVRTTEFGIPHIKGKNFASMGYGLGYAYARDNLCILAREIVTARGEEAQYFGDDPGFVQRSILFSHLSREENLRRSFAAQPREIQDAIHGYAAGYNRWIAETGLENLPAACAGEPWVRKITFLDLAAVHLKGSTRASLSPLAGAIVTAAPPAPAPPAPGAPPTLSGSGGSGSGSAAAPPPTAQAAGSFSEPAYRAFEAIDLPQRIEFPDFDEVLNINRNFGGGSNAYGLGSEATRNGRGMLLGNPHEPWSGIQRFYQAHLEVPGRYNVMGVSQIALPVIVIGFNDSVAWSHTISTAKRFTVHELSLDPSDPLAYFVTNEAGERERYEIETIPVEYSVLGEASPRTHFLYRSHLGFMLNAKAFSGLAPNWGDSIIFFGGPFSVAYTIQDVNEANTRGTEQWLDLGRSRSVEEMKTSLETVLGIPFVNTIAADKHGKALYADIGTVPNVSEEKLLACRGSQVARLFTNSGLVTLDGSRSECDWATDPTAPQSGVLGADDLPSLIRRDYVTNSNDSYWLSNPEAPLEGFSPLLRRDTFNEQSPRLLRTRMGLIQVRERLAGTDGLRGNTFNLKRLQQVFYSNRNYSSELELDAMLDLCDSGDPAIDAWPTSSGGTVDATQACDLLADWNRRDDIESVGVPIWRQFFARLGRQVDKFSVPFDVAEPIDTPRTLTLNDRVIEAFGDAIEELEGLGLPLDSPLGELQYVTSDGEPRADDDSNVIPMHGGSGQNGVFNVATSRISSEGYTPITNGPTYMQTVTWNRRGKLIAEAILGFSQSDDPENPHYSDQTQRYSEKDFIRLPFTRGQIRRKTIARDRLFDFIEVDAGEQPDKW